ncbi:MAG TPA: undecaprenyl-diphosphate phosphatase [Syntrophales bacterium]|nr:undecaprenyl-diphosphate phosphatase [Syntrophales bacterium]
MTVGESLFLGVVQGLTEFLPVSSSGHLVLFQKIFGITEGALIFDVIVHVATAAVLFVIFRRDIWTMIRHPFSRLTLLVVVGTIPTGMIGFYFEDAFEEMFGSGKTLGVEFFFTGLVLWWAETVKEHDKDESHMGYLDALFIGVLQGVAIIPAVSRSGMTIAGALMRGLNRDFAARFSFLLSIPAILGAAAVKTRPLIAMVNSGTGVGITELALGAVAAAMSGYLAVRFMLWVIREKSLRGFAWYVWALGVLIISDQVVFHRFF